MKVSYNKMKILLICVMLALVTFIAYEQVRNYGFVSYDDVDYVYGNQHVKAGLTADSIKWAFTTTHAGNWHPLTWLSHMLDCQLFGNNPGWYHLSNVLFHIANTLLLFAVFKRMTGALWRSAFIAAAFALHPLHVESVAWISERKDVLSSLFWILTMWAYVRYTQRPGIKRYLSTLLFFTLGLMAKPMLVTLPFVLLLLDYWPLSRLQGISKNAEKNLPPAESAGLNRHVLSIIQLIVEKIPLFVISAASCAVTYVAQQGEGAVASMGQLTLKLRMLNAVTSYFSYIVKIFYPTHLAVFYPHSKMFVFRTITVVLLLIVSLVLFIRRVYGRPWLTVGLLWYLGTMVPVIGLVQVGSQAMADRYTYLPSIGIFIIVAWGAAELGSKLPYRRMVLGTLAGLVLTALFICTKAQVRYWQNDVTLFGHALEVTKNNAIMHERYASVMVKEGKLDEAISHYTEALRIKPKLYFVCNNLGLVLLGQGKIDQATLCFEEALRLKPDYPFALNNLGKSLAAQGKMDEAVAYLEKAIRSDPDYPQSYYNIALLKIRQKEYSQAVGYLKEVLQRRPDWPDVCSNLAEAYFSEGDIKQAVYYWRRALELNPQDIKTLNNLAWILATAEDETIRNPNDALKYARKTSELVGPYQQPVFLDTLAAAYAAAGNFPEAVKTAEEAIKLAEAADKKSFADEIRPRLELYKSGQPYIHR